MKKASVEENQYKYQSRFKRLIFGILITLLLTTGGITAHTANTFAAANTAIQAGDAREKHYLVVLKENADSKKLIKTQSQFSNKLRKLLTKNTLSLKLNDIDLQILKKSNDVLLIEEDGVVKASEEKKVRQINETDLRTTSDQVPWNVHMVTSEILQRRQECTGQGIKVAIFDTGIDTTNPDLRVAGGVSFVEGTDSYSDDNGHGTEVAGVIGALDNSSGLLGTAPGVELYAVKVLDQNGIGSYSNIIEGLNWAGENGIDIVVMSFGGTQYSKILEDTINQAYSQNILVIAAAGNSGTSSVDYPAAYPKVVCVGAVDQNRKIASYSNYGPSMDIVAPGVSIVTTAKGSQTATVSGTSFAAPHVAGVAAQILGAKPGLSADQLKAVIYQSAVPDPDMDKQHYGWGIVSALSAYQIIDEDLQLDNLEEPQLENVGPDVGTAGTVSISAKDSSYDNQTVEVGDQAYTRVRFYQAHNECDISITTPSGSTRIYDYLVNLSANVWYSSWSPTLTQAGTYKIRYHCTDVSSQYDDVFTIYATSPQINAPNIYSPSEDQTLPAGSSVNVSWGSVSGATSYRISLYNTSTGSTVISSANVGSSTSYTISSSYLVGGDSYRVTVTALNSSSQASSDRYFNIAAPSLEAPTINTPYSGQTLPLGNVSVTWNWAAGAVSYRISLQNSTTGSTVMYSTNIGNTNSYTLPSSYFTAGNNYCVTVTSVNSSNEASTSRYFSIEKATIGVSITTVNTVQTGKTFTVSSAVNNSSSVTVNNASATISFPSGGFNLASGESATKSLGNIGASGSSSLSWTVVAGPTSSDVNKTIMITASASNANTVQVSKNLTITAQPISGTPAVETIKSSPACQSEMTGNWKIDQPACPVDTATGAYIFNKQLLAQNGAYPFTFDIYYNSLLTSEGALGKGWAHNFETYLETLPDNSVVIHWDKNRRNSFANNNGQLVPQETVNQYDTLIKQTDGGYTLTRQDQSVYVFNPTGQLLQLSNGRGQFLTLNYNSSGQLSTISDPLAGKSLNLSYNPAGLLGSVNDSLGRNVSFTYDDSHNLTGLTDTNNNTTTYTYDSQSRLLSFINGEGIQVVTNTYDSLGRVSSQDDAVAGNGITSFAYDETSQPGQIITTVTDRNGQARVFTHDSGYQLLSIKDELGNTESYSYDAQGNLINQTDAAGHTTKYTYDNRGNALTVTDPANRTTTMTYDNRNNLLSVTNSASKAVNFSYDSNNNIQSITDPLGNTTSLSYDSNGLLTSKTVSGAGTTTYSYQNGLLKSKTDPEGVTTTYTNDNAGRITGITEGAGNTTTLNYDNNDNLLSTTDPLGNRTSTTYDEYGKPLTKTDARGNTIRFEYNNNGSLIRVIDALGNPTRFEYDGEQRLTRTIDSRGNPTTLTLDAKGRVITSTNPLGKTTTYEYNPVDGLTGQTDAMGRRILSITYDALENPVTKTDALGNTTSYQYDQLGRLATITDPLSRRTSYSYDALNRMTSSNDALNGQASQAYDAAGNLTSIIDPNGNRTGFSYDQAGRLIAETSAWGSSKNYTYNTQNLLSEIKNGRGQTAQLSYDAAGRLISLSDPTGNVSYSYDANGNVLTASDAAGTISREYDALNRVTRYTDARGNSISYNYDTVGNLTYMTYPDGKTVHYSYDAARRLTSVTDWAGRTTSYGYDDNDNLISTTRPDGTTESRTYDAANRTTSINDVDNAGKTISQYSFTYDASGNVSGEQAANALRFGMKNAQMTYTSGNRLATFNEQTIEYDADGNMLTGPLHGKMSSFAYDSRNRLISAGDLGYQYDAENNRIGIIDNAKGTQTSYVINPNTVLSQVLSASDADGTTYYVYGLGLLGQENPDGTYQSYHYDLRGSTVALTDLTGKVTDRYQYAPYGEMVKHEGTSATPFQYGGQYGVMTDSNGLYYMRARYYSPEIRRFMSEDSIGEDIAKSQSFNIYTYTWNNPVNMLDPTGYVPWTSISDFKSDWVGREILWHYLYGGGKEMKMVNDEDWNDYMENNTILTSKVKDLVKEYASQVKAGSSKYFKITTAMEIENGEQIIGYQYLHGTNADVGGFKISGLIVKDKNGSSTINFTYQWNDRIDPNFIYNSDSNKAKFAKSIPFAKPKDYTIMISWSDTSKLCHDGTFKSGWLSNN